MNSRRGSSSASPPGSSHGKGQGKDQGRKPSGGSGGGADRGRRRTDEDEDAALRALRSKLAGVLRRLPDVERKVLELRMGLTDGVPAKPGQVAERLGMTINEVRKIEARAFERIREVGPIKGLERFLGK
jgi:DNA-directed RNA polymerase specialized sigma subunit